MSDRTDRAQAPEEARDTPEAEPPLQQNEAAGPSLDPATVCGQAEVCCWAFAAATPHVRPETACAGPREAAGEADADARCQRMKEGWRVAIEAREDVETPLGCE